MLAPEIICMIAIVVLALIGLGIGLAKYKGMSYQESDEEKDAMKLFNDLHLQNNAKEMDIHDVMHTSSTKGFKAV